MISGMNPWALFLVAFGFLAAAPAAETLPELEVEAPAPRVAKIKITHGPADVTKRRTLADSRIAFQPGKRAELRIDGIKGDPKITRLEVAVNSDMAAALQRHIVDVKLKADDKVVAAPKILIKEGSPGVFRFGADDADAVEIEVVIEKAEQVAEKDQTLR